MTLSSPLNTTRAIYGILLVLFALASVADASERESGCTAIRVSAPDAPEATARRARKKATFSASQILDLELQVALAGSVKTGTGVQLKLYTPKGHLYQSISVAASPEETSETDGDRRSRRNWATATLPVAGTTIVTSSLYGNWRVEAYLADSQSPCGRPFEFVIEP